MENNKTLLERMDELNSKIQDAWIRYNKALELHNKYRNPNTYKEWSNELKELGKDSDFEEGIYKR